MDPGAAETAPRPPDEEPEPEAQQEAMDLKVTDPEEGTTTAESGNEDGAAAEEAAGEEGTGAEGAHEAGINEDLQPVFDTSALEAMEADTAAEMAYLEELWEAAKLAPPAEVPPLLMESELIQRGNQRATFAESTAPPAPTTLRGAGGLPAAEEASLRRTQRDLASRHSDHEAARERLADMGLRHAKAVELVGELEAQIDGLMEEERYLAHRTPLPQDRMFSTRQALEAKRAALSQAKTAVAASRNEVMVAEALVQAQATELEVLDPVAKEAERLAGKAAAKRAEQADKLRRRELAAASGYAARMARAEEEREMKARQSALEAEAAIDAAIDGHREAVARLREMHDGIVAANTIAEGFRQEYFEQRAEALMELRRNIDVARADMAKKAAMYNARMKQKDEVFEAEFNDLLESGANPYEVFRRRDIEREVTAKQKKIAANIKKKTEAIGLNLIREEDIWRKKLAEKDKEQMYIDKLNKELGVATKEAKVERYMRETTRDGVSMLDPTSRLPVYSSKAVLAKPWAFGLGTKGIEPDIRTKMENKHPQVELQELLMPRTLREMRSGDDWGMAPPSGEEDGAPAARRKGVDESALVHAQPEFPGTWEKGKASGRLAALAPDLSEFEKRAMKAAHARHQRSIVKPQVVMGRTFEGEAFLPTPAVVEFKDFDVGTKYRKRIIMTNVSWTKNTFKVLDLPIEVRNFFTIDYKPPGHVSAGIAVPLLITFVPQVNEDIETTIPLLAQTGAIWVPMRCLTKKAVLRLSDEGLDFGAITLGEYSDATFAIANDGALSVEYTIEAAGGDAFGMQGMGDTGSTKPPIDDDDSEAEQIVQSGYIVGPAVGVVEGYGRQVINVHFAPEGVGPAQLDLVVKFRVIGNRKYVVPDERISLRAAGTDVPIKVVREVLDFDCCVYNTVYREELVVRNASRAALKVSAPMRPELADYMEFVPDFGYVQGRSEFKFNLRFLPQPEMLRRCAKHLVDAEAAILEIPMKVAVPDQVLPVNYAIRLRLTPSDIVLDPPELDFGQCIMSEATGLVLRITNKSVLTQKFGFMDLPMGVKISPGGGYGTLLGGETVERKITVKPPLNGPQTFDLVMHTLMGRKYTIPCKATGVQPVLMLSHNDVRLAATVVKDISHASVVIFNLDDVPHAFHCGVPEGSDLHITPAIAELPPNGSVRMQIDYWPQPREGDPPGAYDPTPSKPEPTPEPTPEEAGSRTGTPAKGAKKGGAAAAKGAAAKKAAPKGKEKAAPKEPEEPPEEAAGSEAAPSRPATAEEIEEASGWYRWNKWKVPIFIQPSEDTVHKGIPAKLHLNVLTCATPRELRLGDAFVLHPEKGYYEYDFGPVAVGERVFAPLPLQNTSRDPAPMRLDPMDPAGVFSMVSAVREIPPRSSDEFMLDFCPDARKKYWELAVLRSAKTTLRIVLKGEGIAPAITLAPAEYLQNLDMGNTYKDEPVRRTFTLTNVCPFTLRYDLVWRGANIARCNGTNPFSTIPASGTMAEGESAEVTVVFHPDHHGPYYEDVLDVVVPHMQEPVFVPVKARCWEHGVFLVDSQVPEHPFSFSRQIYKQYPDDPLKHAVLEGGIEDIVLGGPGPGGAPEEVVTVTMDAKVKLGQTASATIAAWGLKSVALGGAAGEVAIDDLSEHQRRSGWSIEGAKTATVAGDSKPITVTFSQPDPPLPDSLAYLGMPGYALLEVGARLKGGSPPPADKDGRKVTLKIKCAVIPERPPKPEGDAADGAAPTPTGRAPASPTKAKKGKK